jgi:hypothetical protein
MFFLSHAGFWAFGTAAEWHTGRARSLKNEASRRHLLNTQSLSQRPPSSFVGDRLASLNEMSSPESLLVSTETRA